MANFLLLIDIDVEVADHDDTTGVSLNVFTMSGTLFGIFADQSSDERLKFDIRPTPIDALETLKNIEVCSYSLHPQIAAWFAAKGKDNDTSAN